MAESRCPHCRLALTAEEAVGGSCPWCGSVLVDKAHNSPLAATSAKSSQGATEVSRPRWFLGGSLIALLVVLAVGATMLSVRDTSTPIAGDTAKDTKNVALVQSKKARETGSATSPGNQPKSTETKQSKKNDPAPVKEVVPAESKNAEPPKKPEEIVENPVERKKPAEIVENAIERKLYLPDGVYTISTISNRTKLKLKGTVKTLKVETMDIEGELDVNGLEAEEIVFGRIANRSKVKLKGNVRTLKVGSMENDAELDASGLEAKEIVLGRIAFRCKVKLNAPGGKIDFRGMLDGPSVLTILAPEGTVTFSERIDNDARLTITAKQVEFQGIIAGNQTLILVTLTPTGRIQFREIAGTARMLYRKANAADPEPVVQAGTVGSRAKFSRQQ
jgi:hypothetical protein